MSSKLTVKVTLHLSYYQYYVNTSISIVIVTHGLKQGISNALYFNHEYQYY